MVLTLLTETFNFARAKMWFPLSFGGHVEPDFYTRLPLGDCLAGAGAQVLRCWLVVLIGGAEHASDNRYL